MSEHRITLVDGLPSRGFVGSAPKATIEIIGNPDEQASVFVKKQTLKPGSRFDYAVSEGNVATSDIKPLLDNVKALKEHKDVSFTHAGLDTGIVVSAEDGSSWSVGMPHPGEASHGYGGDLDAAGLTPQVAKASNEHVTAFKSAVSAIQHIGSLV
ncbi:hypothetical protein GQ42DRAFT_163605 [Ramicandelaber brevisporus]|nr:hypothetical protein GQ42DRAFT_163605 [Ramicandelaber brevisporus]